MPRGLRARPNNRGSTYPRRCRRYSSDPKRTHRSGSPIPPAGPGSVRKTAQAAPAYLPLPDPPIGPPRDDRKLRRAFQIVHIRRPAGDLHHFPAAIRNRKLNWAALRQGPEVPAASATVKKLVASGCTSQGGHRQRRPVVGHDTAFLPGACAPRDPHRHSAHRRSRPFQRAFPPSWPNASSPRPPAAIPTANKNSHDRNRDRRRNQLRRQSAVNEFAAIGLSVATPSATLAGVAPRYTLKRSRRRRKTQTRQSSRCCHRRNRSLERQTKDTLSLPLHPPPTLRSRASARSLIDPPPPITGDRLTSGMPGPPFAPLAGASESHHYARLHRAVASGDRRSLPLPNCTFPSLSTTLPAEASARRSRTRSCTACPESEIACPLVSAYQASSCICAVILTVR